MLIILKTDCSIEEKNAMLSQIAIKTVFVMRTIINCSLFQLYNNRILLCCVLTWNAIYFCWKRIDGLGYWPELLDFIATIKFCTQLCNQSDFNNKFGPCMLSLRLVRWSDRSLIWKVQKHLLHSASMGVNTQEHCNDFIRWKTWVHVSFLFTPRFPLIKEDKIV